MSEALQFSLDFDASSAVTAAKQAADTIETNFKNAYDKTKATYANPLQMKLDLRSDAQKKLDEVYDSTNKIKRETGEINKRYKLSQKLQDRVKNAVNGTKKEKEKTLKLVERLQKRTNLTAKEMKTLAKYAKDLRNSLPKPSEMPSGERLSGFTGSLTKAGIVANLATKGIEMLGRAVGEMVKTGLQMQTLNLQMEAFTGSVQQAEKAMSKFKDIAAKSPLDLLQVADAGKIMMAFGLSTNQATKATEQLAIISAATGGELNNMARNLGQIQAQGRAYTRDLTQFAIQGVPIWDELSKVTGNSVQELKKMATEGEIGFQAVSAALRNMTKDGTAFSEIAERMQETYAGKLALLQSNFQETSGEIVESISRIDKALGGVSDKIVEYFSGVMKDMNRFLGNSANLIEQLEYYENFKPEGSFGIGDLFVEAGKAIEGALGYIYPFKTGVEEAVDAVNYFGENTSPQFNAVKDLANELGLSMTELQSKVNQLNQQTGNENFKNEFSNAATAVGEVTTKLEEQQREYLRLQGITDSVIQRAIDANEEKKQSIEDQLQDEMLMYEKLKESANNTYRNIKATAESNIEASNKKIELLQKEIDKTRELGPAGKKLEEIRIKELKYTARTGEELEGHVSAEQRKKLEAQASLERIRSQEEAERLAKEQAKEREKIAIEQNRLKEAEAEKTARLLDIQKQQAASQEKFNQELESLTGVIDKLAQAMGGDLLNNFDLVVKEAGKVAPETTEATNATFQLNGAIRGTQGELNTVIRQLNDIADKIRNMPKLKTGAPNAFTGGPVSGGEVRTVNELGKEAFLSASGKLSMINAPAWNEWRAPTSGTIIPAHLTKQLNIPTGGINLNKAPGAGANVNKAVRTVQAAAGDVFNQNVTVQAANPVQAANNMMVEMTRLRRRRFG